LHRRLFSICQIPGDVPFKISAPHDLIFELAIVTVVVRKPSQFGAEHARHAKPFSGAGFAHPHAQFQRGAP